MRFWVVASLMVLFVMPAAAQDVVPFLREERFLARAREIIAEHGERPAARPWQPHPWADSTLLARIDALPHARAEIETVEVLPPAPVRVPLEVKSVQVIHKLQQGFFERLFGDTEWAYLGSNHVTALDTTLTWRLRAALEAEYGSPTNTVVEIGQDTTLTLGNAAQFEYWFIVNDTIPVVASDVSGPLDRGLVLASDRRLRERLTDLRDAIFEPLARADAPRVPFADYFYEPEGRRWFLVGFDGFRFVMRATRRPTLRMGRPFVKALH